MRARSIIHITPAFPVGGAEKFLLSLANGLAGGDHDARQPILIAPDVTPANGARFLALADGIWREPDEGIAVADLIVLLGDCGVESSAVRSSVSPGADPTMRVAGVRRYLVRVFSTFSGASP